MRAAVPIAPNMRNATHAKAMPASHPASVGNHAPSSTQSTKDTAAMGSKLDMGAA